MGTILMLVVYFLANLALPFYYRKYRPAGVQRGQARHPAGARHGRHRRPGLLPGQARQPRRTTGSRTPRWASSWCPSSTRSGWTDAIPALGDRVGLDRGRRVARTRSTRPARQEYRPGGRSWPRPGCSAEPVRFAYYGLEEPPKDEVLAGEAPRPAAARVPGRRRQRRVDRRGGVADPGQVVSARTLDPAGDGQLPILDRTSPGGRDRQGRPGLARGDGQARLRRQQDQDLPR